MPAGRGRLTKRLEQQEWSPAQQERVLPDASRPFFFLSRPLFFLFYFTIQKQNTAILFFNLLIFIDLNILFYKKYFI